MPTSIGESPIQRPAWKRLIGRGLKRLLAWRYRHFRPGAEPARYARVAGRRLYVAAGVFHPGRHWTSPFLAWGLRQPGVVPPGGSVLDLGTGSGLAALVAAEAGAGRVVATDLSPAAVRCAAVNIAQAGVADRVVVRQGDLFAPVTGERFDLIISNPPYLRGVPLTLAEHAYLGGSHYEWLDRFAAGAADYLTPRGRVLVVLGDAADVPTILAHLRAPGWHVRPVARQDIWVEVLYLFSMTRSTGDFT